MLAHIDLQICREHVYVGLKGRAIFRVLNTTTLKEEVYGNVDFNEYKFLKLLDPINNLLNTRKNPPTKKLVEDPSKNPMKSLNIPHRESREDNGSHLQSSDSS